MGEVVFADRVLQLHAAIDEVCEADPMTLADGETMQSLYRELERLNAAVARATAAFESDRTWEADGARSAAAWISVRCGQPIGAARRRVRLGRALRAMPATEAAWLAGDIGAAHVEPLAAVRRRVGGEAFDPDEASLVERASTLRHCDFLGVLAYWFQAADPNGVEQDAQAQRDARRLHLSQSFEGAWFLDGLLDPISGEAFSKVLRSIEDELFAADWAAAKEELGDEVSAASLARTPAQRRADALVEMARRPAAMPSGARLPKPLVTVLVGYETFAGRVCELASGAVVTPGSLLPWLTDAYVERVVFEGPDRVKNVGVRRRLFSGATRRAVEVRGKECFSEFCDVPADECDIDHIRPHGEGGLTVDENGRPACSYHNRRRLQPP
jgi:hypothetical protein